MGKKSQSIEMYRASTVRDNFIRVISAGIITKNEVQKYEEKIKRDFRL